MVRYGIPAYRMPREVLRAEVERIAALGVRFTATTE
jgi:NADPH-dependent glutamate synthase beta subunit-like oxidoreductase